MLEANAAHYSLIMVLHTLSTCWTPAPSALYFYVHKCWVRKGKDQEMLTCVKRPLDVQRQQHGRGHAAHNQS